MKYERDFLIFPQHANHKKTLIFGGAFLAELDLTAAFTVSKFLKENNSKLESVTHKLGTTTFHKPSYVGDCLNLMGEITEANGKHICLTVKAYRNKELIADTSFVFITIIPDTSLETKPKFLPYTDHNIVYP